MMIRKFDPETLDSEPHKVLFRDLYPWEQIDETPFGASLAVVEGGGQTMVHSHHPAETFIICSGRGTMTINEETSQVAAGDVIYLPPGSVHNLMNDSETESLMFLSVFWDAPDSYDDEDDEEDEGDEGDEKETLSPAPRRLFLPSPPTPNGPLHLGHLAGPYLVADALRRWDRLRGRASEFVCLSDDHQSYTALRARFEEEPLESVMARFSDQMEQVFAAAESVPDRFIRSSQDVALGQAVAQAFERLRPLLQEREVEDLYCPGCQHFLYDGDVSGHCPHCGEGCRGFLCENCCLPSQPGELEEPGCVHCEAVPERRPVKRLFLPVAPQRQGLEAFHAQVRLSPRLRSLAQRMLSQGEIFLSVSYPNGGRWGKALPGLEGQRLSPWMEVALAQEHLRGDFSEVVHSFGYDNAFLYLVHDPAVGLALGWPMPTGLVANEYLMLDEGKMSTSSAHSLPASEVLAQLPADLVRFYLASIRPEQVETTCSLERLVGFCRYQVAGPWQDWLERLGRSLAQESASKAPEATSWTPEQAEFHECLHELMIRAARAYDRCSLQEAARVLHELVERASLFSLSQVHYVQTPARATALALELAAVKLLASLSWPILPRFAGLLWKHLGFRHTLEQEGWPAQVYLLPPGQRVLATAGMASRRYFPEIK